MNKYDHNKIEKKWQKYWEAHKIFAAKDADKKPKKYILDMFPYPSGAGLHVGHPEGYTATDILSRYSRMNGFNVLHPMGWDAFGLPAENYAIKMGVHPQQTTQKNIKRFTEQIKSIGLSYDWSREINTSDPEYYKWTQWLFLQLYKKGLAYKKEASVNWCPKDNTVLANEQVINGACERCGTTVVQKNLSQWFFKITNYAEELLSDLNKLDWPEPIKLMQKNWIGKSVGAEIPFSVIASSASDEAILSGEKIASAATAMTQKLKPNFLILHGRNGSPDSHTFPWLKEQLESKGYKVQVPALPNTSEPDDEEQAQFVFKNCKLDENTVIIGHSFGGIVALRLLEKGIKVNKVVLMCTPFSGKFLDKKSRLSVTRACQKGFDFSKIRTNAKGFMLLYDTGDDVVPMSDGEAFAEKLNGNLLKLKGNIPHLSGQTEPGVLESLLFDYQIKVFTTRPDTIFGATYMVLAPEHRIIENLKFKIENWGEVQNYIDQTKKKSELQRTQLEKEKTGVELKGIKAVNPATKQEIPVWIADYVITGYGTGAIMAVPAHDERDFEFAKKYVLPIKSVVAPTTPPRMHSAPLLEKEGNIAAAVSPPDKGEYLAKRGEGVGVFTAYGNLINSGEFTGMKSEDTIGKMGLKFGKLTTKYKLRDWLVSRQRYWGAPIPIIHCQKCGMQPVPEKDLPVKLPTDADFRPTGESPLKRSKSFKKVVCPKCKGKAERDYDTIDTFVDSSWYFLRYADPKNKTKFADGKKLKEWLPVNVYVGGAEHAVLHLLYARFFTKALRDFGLLDFGEPFLKLRNQGLILGPDGEKMSKSRGNVINPDDVIKEFGADSFRMYEMFMGPLEDAKPWQTQGIVGIKRFLDRVWNWVNACSQPIHGLLKTADKSANYTDSDKIQRALNKLIKKITEDIENFHFNTCISAFMEFHNEVKDEPVSLESIKTFLKLLYPFAPHISEELNQLVDAQRGHANRQQSLQNEEWPAYDPKLIVDQTVEIVVQVNGKVKGKVSVPTASDENTVKELGTNLTAVKILLSGQTIKRVVFVKDRLINFVI